MKYFLLTITTFFLLNASFAQIYYKTMPLKGNFSVSGNFGQIRPNHFHSGIDLRTSQIGVPVTSVADGYVSRIKVSADGYGKALYITHYNGHTSVYAHLSEFIPEIQKYVYSLQYKLKSYEFTDYTDTSLFKIKEGQIVAFSGNSGRSTGPHLHFEIRDADKDIPLNPELFGFNALDTKNPQILSVFFYPLSKNSTVDKKNQIAEYKVFVKGKLFGLNRVPQLSGKIAIGIEAFDKINTSDYKQSVYAVKVSKDDSILFEYKKDTISFYESHFVNSFKDYEKYVIKREKVINLYTEPGNNLSIYKKSINNGFIHIDDDKIHKIKIILTDFAQNKSVLEFDVKGNFVTSSNKNLETEFLNYDKDNFVVKQSFRAVLQKGSLFDDTEFFYNEKNSDIYFSKIHTLQDSYTPLRQAVIISILPDKQINTEKTLIAKLNANGNVIPLETYYINGFFSAKTKSLGSFALVQDIIPPQIYSENPTDSADYSQKNYIELKINDNLSGIKNYYTTIDGNFILFEHDKKTNSILYFFDNKLIYNKFHELVVTAEDKKNNKAVFKTVFFK